MQVCASVSVWVCKVIGDVYGYSSIIRIAKQAREVGA